MDMEVNIPIQTNSWQIVPSKPSANTNKRRAHALPVNPATTKQPKTTEANRFSIISPDDDDDNISLEGTDEINAAAKETGPKPPPIIIPNISNISEMIKSFCSIIAKNEFKFKTLNDGQVRVMVSSVEAYRKLIKHLESSNTIFHTYQIKQDRAYRVVIKNLHFSTNVDDIRSELLAYGHDSRNIINIKNRYTKEPLSMFYVDLEPKVNNKDIYDIVHLNNNIIKIEPPRKTNDLVQCHRCQQFGHTKSYCKKPFKCVKCALDHATTECKKDINTPPQCVHCLKNHTANYKGCSFYKELLSKKSNSNTIFQSRQNGTYTLIHLYT